MLRIESFTLVIILIITSLGGIGILAQPQEIEACLVPSMLSDTTLEVISDPTPPTLSQILSDYGLSVNVNDSNQIQAWFFGTDVTNVRIRFEYIGKEAGNANIFGYCYDGAINSFVPLMQNSTHDGFRTTSVVSPGDTQTITIQRGTHEYLSFGIFSDDSTKYGRVGTNRSFFTSNSSNAYGADRSLVYDLSDDVYLLCFEDRPTIGVEHPEDGWDFDDFIVLMEVIDCGVYDAWDSSNIEVTGTCESPYVTFTLTNTGNPSEGDMDAARQYRVYRDGVLEESHTFQLLGGESLQINVTASCNDIRLEADQHPNHPEDNISTETITDCDCEDACVDNDQDGYCEDVDCDDSDPNVHPNASELCGNGIDDDCDDLIDEQCEGSCEGNHAPNIPEIVSPANGSTVTMSVATISWTGGDQDSLDTLTYYIYFGINESNISLHGTSSSWPSETTGPFTSNLGITLFSNQTYYWKIIAEDACGSQSESNVWSFTKEMLDSDEDMIADEDDNCLESYNPDQTDTDGDGMGDACDDDDDGDGILDEFESDGDTDSDGIPDQQDDDDDGDGTPTENEQPDDNHDGNPDDAADSDEDGTPDYLDPTDDIQESDEGSSHHGGSSGGSTSTTVITSSKPDNRPPVAIANGPYTINVDDMILMNASESYDPDGDLILSYLWDFGDGTNATGVEAIHIYSSTGEYSVTLKVTDTNGLSDEYETTAMIVQPNRPPMKPEISSLFTIDKDVEMSYSAQSTDPDDDTITYTFDWGDESIPQISPWLPSGEPSTMSHTWNASGTYMLTVTASDGEFSTKASVEITVLEPNLTGLMGYGIIGLILVIMIGIAIYVYLKRKKAFVAKN
jgi:hypothetical protein